MQTEINLTFLPETSANDAAPLTFKFSELYHATTLNRPAYLTQVLGISITKPPLLTSYTSDKRHLNCHPSTPWSTAHWTKSGLCPVVKKCRIMTPKVLTSVRQAARSIAHRSKSCNTPLLSNCATKSTIQTRCSICRTTTVSSMSTSTRYSCYIFKVHTYIQTTLLWSVGEEKFDAIFLCIFSTVQFRRSAFSTTVNAGFATKKSLTTRR